MMLLAFMWLFSQVQAPVIPNGAAIFAEDRQGQVYLLVDTQPRRVLVWNAQEMAKSSAANDGEVTLIRAGREMLALNSSVFPGQMTRDQHVNGWRLARDSQNPTSSRIEVRPAGAATYTFSPQANGVLRYQPLKQTWDKLPSPPDNMTLWAAICGAHQDEMWIMGGNTDKKLSFIWSPTTNAWRSGPNLPTPLGWTSAQEVDGRLIITPGGTSTKQLDDFIFTDTVYELRPVSRTEPTKLPLNSRIP